MNHKDWTLEAYTDIWTGDAEQKENRLITTGLLGSIRWWFEVLVRGLSGKACDPTSSVRCPDSRGKDPVAPGHHCVVCELFGCTGWARKFRLTVLDANGSVQTSQVKKGGTFTLRFTELRPIYPEEWALLDLTLRLIADYGAIGGKTVYKPSDEPSRQNAPHHRDYGLVKVEQKPHLPQLQGDLAQVLPRYVNHRWATPKEECFSWASLEHFWCMKGLYLARQDANTSTFNRVIGRPEPKPQSQGGDSWLAGRRARGGSNPQPAESKKVFSFKEPESARRTFGFVKPGLITFNEMRQRLQRAWPDLRRDQFFEGPEILKELLKPT